MLLLTSVTIFSLPVSRDVLGPTVRLNSACGPDDVCADVNALCVGGLCRCRPLYYEESNVCSQCWSRDVTSSLFTFCSL